MNWLLNSWSGRLYLVIQIACLVITIARCQDFFGEDRKAEWIELRENQNTVQSNPNLFGPDKERQQASLRFLGGEIVKRHSKQRQEAILYCIGVNLGVPVVFSVAFFVVKGLPRQKS